MVGVPIVALRKAAARVRNEIASDRDLSKRVNKLDSTLNGWPLNWVNILTDQAPNNPIQIGQQIIKIQYVHLESLGAPRPMRTKREAGESMPIRLTS